MVAVAAKKHHFKKSAQLIIGQSEPFLGKSPTRHCPLSENTGTMVPRGTRLGTPALSSQIHCYLTKPGLFSMMKSYWELPLQLQCRSHYFMYVTSTELMPILHKGVKMCLCHYSSCCQHGSNRKQHPHTPPPDCSLLFLHLGPVFLCHICTK